jgi:hypothetical protein
MQSVIEPKSLITEYLAELLFVIISSSSSPPPS